MDVYVLDSGRRIAPFGDAPGEALIHNRPLSEWQAEAFRDAGLTVAAGAPAGPCLVVPDTLYTNGRALLAFLDGAAGKNGVLVLKESLFGSWTTPVNPRARHVEGVGHRFEDVRFLSGTDEPVCDVVVDPDEQELKVELPEYYLGTPGLSLGLPKRPFMELHHWCHVLWANQAAWAVEARNRSAWRWILWGLWALLRAFSFNKWKILAKMNRIGRKCDIHPTAVVEYSVIGDGVTIGPHARVRFARVGAGTTIMDGACVEWSSVGERCIVNQMGTVRYCVLYPEAISGHHLIQLSVLGRRAVTTYGSNCIDVNFAREIRVPLDGELHSIGQRSLGCALGHGSRLGTGFWIASGRMVPNDCFIVLPPHEVVHTIDQTLGGQGPVARRDGVLVPVGRYYEEEAE